ncbi:MAG: cellulase family glycosylhydrolase [Bryobacterales bacterium]|nr:cellulase family glycosylhydrolase [Bryobacterales bacterium]
MKPLSDEIARLPSRRGALKAGLGAGLVTSVTGSGDAAGFASPKQQGAKPSDYSAVRGFNYMPSYAAHSLDIWRRFDAKTVKKEISSAKKYFPRINTVRIFLSWDAFYVEPAAFMRNFDAMLTALHSFQLRAIPTIFNAWHGIPDFGGVTNEHMRKWRGERPVWDAPFLNYLKAVVAEHANDDRILIWDLCNEPWTTDETALMWVSWLYETAKSLGPKAPVCVGNMPNLSFVKATERVSDVLAWHPYWSYNRGAKPMTREQHVKYLDECVAYARSVGKPLLATECCWGSLDDKQRADVVAFELSELKARGIGWTAHAMVHSLVADCHRPEFGFIAPAQYMAFIERDGSLRRYHDVFNKFV